MHSIVEKLDNLASADPDKLLYSFLDINGTGIDNYTYSDFVRRTNIIAGNLSHSCHIKSGARVLLAFPPGIEMISAFFACARLGMIPVPVYPPAAHGFKSAMYKMTFIAKDCQASAILTNNEYYWSFKLNLERNNLYRRLVQEGPLSNLPWVNTEDFHALVDFTPRHNELLFIQYTSGSTSEPKGVMVSHQNTLHNCALVNDHTPVCVSWLPQYHDMGLIGYYIFVSLQGGTTYGFSSANFIQRPALWLEAITRYKATASSAPNFAFEYCLQPGKIPEEVFSTLDLSTLETLMTAAEPVRSSTYLRFLERCKGIGLRPKHFFAAYGLAENTLAVTNYGRTVLPFDKDALKQKRLKIVPHTPHAPLLVSCGKPLGDTIVKIVDPETCRNVEDGHLGEIWISGQSKCLGYWNKPELTKNIFQASITGENSNANNYLRTGDIGFIHDEELYVCGRYKDMIIVRGANYFPQDIEKIVEQSSDLVRLGCVAAFELSNEEKEEKLVVVAGIKNAGKLPDASEINEEIRRNLGIAVHSIVFVPARSIPKTSSGKITRYLTRKALLEGELKILRTFHCMGNDTQADQAAAKQPFLERLKAKYSLAGQEEYSLADAGIDSIDLVALLHDIREIVASKAPGGAVKELDTRFLQRISIAELFNLMEQFNSSSLLARARLKAIFMRLQREHNEHERAMMLNDIRLSFSPKRPAYTETGKGNSVFLTGGTGFFGPFILKSLLEQTDQRLYVLVRASSEEQGKQRLRMALETVAPVLPCRLSSAFDQRVVPVCGDLGQPMMGLTKESWESLSKEIGTIYNNGAVVNYLYNYDKMRRTNVFGTDEILRFSFEGRPKVFNHISTTFIFGWAVKSILFESDCNDDLYLLDFGYSQTKWVSEKLVIEAQNKGLRTRIFRPALITPSINGGGDNFDIAIRLLAFMITHGITVSAHNQVSFTPADISANNIVSISNLPETFDTVFHVTRDHYSSMKDITDIISRLTGRIFKVYPLSEFVPIVVEKCTKKDILFPLLDFLVRSVDNISSMEFKRYESSNYKQARDGSKEGIQDPSLEDTVRGMLLFMIRKGIINAEILVGDKIL